MAAAFTAREFTAALLAEFGTAIESVTGRAAVTGGGGPADGPGWAMQFTATGDLRGSLLVWIDRAGAARVAGKVLGLEDGADDGSVGDLLREMFAQAASALSLKAPFTGVSLVSSGPVACDADRSAAAFELALDEPGGARLAVWGDADVPPAPALVPVNAKLEVVLDIDLPIVVRFGRTVMSLKALAALGPGSIVDMGRSPDEPVQMLVGDQVIARGEVVIVGGNYGVRITDLVSPADRVRALEA